MSWFKCPHCGEPSFIFGKAGAQKTADEMGLEFLGEVRELVSFFMIVVFHVSQLSCFSWCQVCKAYIPCFFLLLYGDT